MPPMISRSTRCNWPNFRSRNQFDERLILRPASTADIDQLVAVQVSAFSEPLSTVKRRITAMMGNPLCRYYIATLGELPAMRGEVVGSLRLEMDEEIGIYAFAVHADYQGRGYGRQILEEVITRLHEKPDTRQKNIMLDVETDNYRAFNLYRSCGFQVRATYDYFNYFIQTEEPF